MKRWQNRVAVITGAAAGIGAAVVKDLLEGGLIVVGLDKQEKRMCELKANLPLEQRTRFVAIKCDVTSVQDVDEAFDRIISDHGAVDILINNAGIHLFGKLCEVDLSIAQQVMQTNVMSAVHCTQRAFKSMKARDFDGHIIFLNSISGHTVPQSSVGVSNMYIPSKYAMTAMNEVLRQEFRDHGTRIKVTNVCPGFTDTEMVPDAVKAKLDGRILSAGDIAQVVMYILSTPPHVQIHDITIKPMGEQM